MNTNCFRIVFNERRSQYMAVAEIVLRGGSGPTRRLRSTQSRPSWTALFRPTMLAVAMACGISALAWTPAVAQIISDPSAPSNQRPTILSDSTGRPLINIQTPSAAGLSRNTYKQFDVQSNGVVLNNSSANPWLSNGVLAKTILNEVNSTSQSYINGAITVNGASAQVILANPNGITVNGGSFVNANRATLTTGTAQVNNGSLSGFDVRGGGITVGPGGLNSSATPYTDLLSRVVTLTGNLQAQNLSITTGLQTVDYKSGLISNQDTNAYSATGVSIDTAALGGMSANSISLLATEAGMGVRNQGIWQATGGQIVVTADGLLQNQGSISAGVASLATVRGNIENSSSLQATQAVLMSAGGDVNLYGTGLKQIAGSAVQITANGAVNLLNNPYYGAAQVSSNSAGGQININAGQNINLNPGTAVAASGDVQLSSDAFVVANYGASVTSSAGKVMALAGKGISLAPYSRVTGQQVHLETGSAFKDSAASLTINGSVVRGETQTTLIATDSIQIFGAGTTPVSSGANVFIQAANSLDIGPGSTLTAGQHMSLVAGSGLNIQATSGTTGSGQRVALTAGANMLLSAGSIAASGASLNAGSDIDIEASGGNVNLSALYNMGGMSVDKLYMNAGKDLNVSAFKGNVIASGVQADAQNIALLSNGNTSLSNGTISYGGNYQAFASVLSARDDLVVGSISDGTGSSTQVQIIGSSLNAGGQAKVLSNGTTRISLAANYANGVVSPSRSNSITAGSVLIQGGTVQITGADIRANGDRSSTTKSGDIVVTATNGSNDFGNFLGASTLLNSTGNIALHANGNLTHSGTQANASGGISNTSATGQIRTSYTSFIAKDVLSFASKQDQSHSYDTLIGGVTSLFNESGALTLNGASVQALGSLNIGLNGISGKLSFESGGPLTIDSTTSLKALNDLSITQGSGDITVKPKEFELSGLPRRCPAGCPSLFSSPQFPYTITQDQIEFGRDLTLFARNGDLKLSGQVTADGRYGERNALIASGQINLIGNNVFLQGSVLQAGRVNLTATTGDVSVSGLEVVNTKAPTYMYYGGTVIMTDPGGDITTSWERSRLLGSGGVSVIGARDVTLSSVDVQSRGTISLQSGANLSLTGNYTRQYIRPINNGGWTENDIGLGTSYLYGGQIEIGAMGGSLKLNSTDVYALGGVKFKALGDINIESGQTHVLRQRQDTYSTSSWLGLQDTTYTIYQQREYLKNRPVSIVAGNIDVIAGNSVNTYGTKFNANGNLSFQAGDGINYFAVLDQEYSLDSTTKQSSFFGITYGNTSSTSSANRLTGQPTQLQSLADITSSSGGNQLLQGTKVSYGSTATFQAGVGEKARSDARILLEGIKNSTIQTRTQQSNYAVWQSMVNSGSQSETLVLPSFSGPTKPAFSAPGGLNVQIPDGNFKGQITTLTSQPGMGYLADLTLRNDVNWQPVKLAYEQWNYQQSGLTPAGAALLAVAVAWAMPAGAGANLVGANAGTTGAAVANAAFTSLAAQASISFVNNKGDIGKTLQELGSSQTVKAALGAVLTAGVLDKLGTTSLMKDLAAQTGFSEKLTFNLINATGRALTNVAINGGSLEDALKQALIGGIVDTAHGQVASQIKSLESDYLAHKLAHALAGCVAGAAAGGSCQDGAIGGAVGEIVADMFKGQKPAAYASAAEIDAYSQKVLAYSKLVAGTVSAYSGGNAQTAITTAETAVKNNFLTENRYNSRASQWSSFKQELDSCRITAGCDVNGVYSRWTTISNDQQRQAMGSLDALFAVNPTEASTAGQWFGKAVSSLYVDAKDVCGVSDTRCVGFVEAQKSQAMAVYRSGLALAYSNDLIDGGGRSISSVLDAPPTGPKTASTLNQQQVKNAELLALFDKSNPSNSLTLGNSNYKEISTNYYGNSKIIDTGSLSTEALTREVFSYAQQLAGGKSLTRHPNAPNLWYVEVDSVTVINVRDISTSTSKVGRWTIDVVRSPSLSSLGYTKNDIYKLKFE